MSARRVLLIDNHDSFTFNVVQALRALGAVVDVRENDRFDAGGLARIAPTHVVISPGPGRPERAGCTPAVVDALCTGPLAGGVALLGICLGHQAIVDRLGGRVVRARTPMHGKPSAVYHDRRGLLEGLPNPFAAGRYHSLCADEASLPDCLRVSAYTSDGEVMGVRHRTLPVEGLQFHPESVLTPCGTRLLRNFLELAVRAPSTSSIPATPSSRSHA
jgi:anthranilate synthase/aminodeoxychorismate synthase-like glutamine amidotransferase